MKILIAGDFHSDIHEKSFYNAFIKLGHEVRCFEWHTYFKDYHLYRSQKTNQHILNSIYYRLQNKFLVGPAIKAINLDFSTYCDEFQPDLVFIYRGTHIFPETIKKIKSKSCLVFGYNNDDPFNKNYPHYLWRYFLGGLALYNHIFAYRNSNIDEYRRLSANVSLLRSSYIKERNFPLDRPSPRRWSTDVAFIGHFENDGREEYIKIIIEQGILFKLYGTDWQHSKYADFFTKKLGGIKPGFKEYNALLNSTKIALVFLSKKNHDTYTRRCFEIPATKTFMLSQYSDDLAALFKENAEVVFFRDKSEMIEKIQYYLQHDEERERIALAGYERLLRDGHEVTDRANEILRVYHKLTQT
jgi:spore maturation protein CgeB